MNPKEALEAAISKAGSQSALATMIGCTTGAVWQMLNKQDAMISPQYVLKAEAGTGVSRHDLRPDLYPREVAA